MKLHAAKQLLSQLEGAISEAEIAGSNDVKLIDSAKKLDDEARKSLVDAITEAEAK